MDIVIPDSVEKIEFEAFRGCDKLENIKLSENLTIVGYGVFGDCKSISKIEIPKKLKNLMVHGKRHKFVIWGIWLVVVI